MVETFVQSTDDVVKFLKGQHDLIKDMFEDVFSASDPKAREKAFVELRQLLAVHETAEEMVVHPRARQEIADGDEIVDARLREEHEAKQQLSTLTDDEKQEMRDSDDRARMAKAVQAAEAIAPTRPHPGVESAKLNFAAGPFASMLDRARDLIKQATS